MVIGIDLNGDILRYTIGEGSEPITGSIMGIQGILPRKNESIIWNNPKALRHTFLGEQISLGSLWLQFQSDPDSIFQWNTEDGTKLEAPVVQLIADAVTQNLPMCKTSKMVFTVSNLFSEVAQDRLIGSMRNAGIANFELLWRPIAIALTDLSSGDDRYNEGDHILIIDSESTGIELTQLELRDWNNQLIPKRYLPTKGKKPEEIEISITSFRETIANNVACGDKQLISQLFTGPFASEFIASIV